MSDEIKIVVKPEDQALIQLANQFEKEAEKHNLEAYGKPLIHPIEYFDNPIGKKEMTSPITFFESRFQAEVVYQKDLLAQHYQADLQLPQLPTLVFPERKNSPSMLQMATNSLDGKRVGPQSNSAYNSLVDLEEILLRTIPLKRHREDLFAYDGFHYRYLSDNEVKGLIFDCLRNNLRLTNASAQINSLLALLKAEVQILDQPDEVPHRLAVQNGELDLEQLRLYPPMPEHFHTHYLDVPWHGYQPCPRFQEFLSFISGSCYALKQRILEAMGYLLVPDNRAKRFVLFQGVGNTGKSVLGDLIRSFYETSAVSALAAHQLGERFSASFLARRSINISMDLPGGVLDQKAVAVLKQITGGDLLSIEGKNRDAYADHLNCKMLFGTNHPLILKDRDEAFAKRVLLIPFRFPVPEEQMDRELLQKLKEERSGILYLALTAYREAVRRNYQFSGEERFGFKPQQIVIQENPQSGVEAFVVGCCVFDGESFTSTEAIHTAYLDFCEQNGKAAIPNLAAFSRALKTHVGNKIKSDKRRLNGSPMNGYIGISLKEEHPHV